MNHDMDDTEENKNKIALFVAQEVIKDKKIPHFSREAVEEKLSSINLPVALLLLTEVFVVFSFVFFIRRTRRKTA